MGVCVGMKNQYFGDINDYKKYGLLRSIVSAGDMSVLVAWMLTPDDGSSDGKFIEYLGKPSVWEKYDPSLYRGLVRLMGGANERNVALIEASSILNGCSFFSESVPDAKPGRETWFSSLLNESINHDLVFLDPDNGLEIKSRPYGRKNSSKFLYWREVSKLWVSGKSLLMYQHFIREKRDDFIQRMLKSLNDLAEHSSVEAFSTQRVVFLLALQPEHHHFRQTIIDKVNVSWRGQIKNWGLRAC